MVARLSLYWGDEASKTNRAHACGFAGGMLMRGTQKHTRAELRDAFDQLKANVSVGVDGASIDVRRAQLDDTLRLVAEVLREPAFPATEFEELRRAALTGAESQRGDPAAIAGERLARHLYPYPRGHWHYAEPTDERIAEHQGGHARGREALLRATWSAQPARSSSRSAISIPTR